MVMSSNDIGNHVPTSGGSNSNRHYFLSNSFWGSHHAHHVAVFESAPDGTTEDEFAPRQLRPANKPGRYAVTDSRAKSQNRGTAAAAAAAAATSSGDRSGRRSTLWPIALFGIKKRENRKYGDFGTLLKLRKVPVKVEPKVYFANERTFLAWMHLSVIIAGASIAILVYAEGRNRFSQVYGILLLPVAVAFIIYSMYQYNRRAHMIRNRLPGPYHDTTGPTVLGIMLMLSILAQFSIKMYDMYDMST